MSSESQPSPDITSILTVLKQLEKETAKLQAAGRLGQGTLQTLGIGFQGLLTLIGDWINAFGQACAATTTPAGLAGLAIFLVANGIALEFFLTTEPFKTMLKTIKLDVLVNRLMTLSLGNLLGSQPPPVVSTGTGGFCYRVTLNATGQALAVLGGLPGVSGGTQSLLYSYLLDACFPDQASRDAAVAKTQSQLNNARLPFLSNTSPAMFLNVQAYNK